MINFKILQIDSFKIKKPIRRIDDRSIDTTTCASNDRCGISLNIIDSNRGLSLMDVIMCAVL